MADQETLQALKNDIRLAIQNKNPALANKLSAEYERLSQQGSQVSPAAPTASPDASMLNPVPTATPTPQTAPTASQEAVDKPFTERVSEAYQQGRVNEAGILVDPEADPMSKGYRMFANKMGTAGQIAAIGLGELIPDAWKEAAVDTAKENWGKLMENDTFANMFNKALEGSTEAYRFLNKEFPQEMKNLNATLQIGEWVTPAKFRMPNTRLDPVARIAQGMIDSGTEGVLSQRRRWAQELVRKEARTEDARMREGLGQREDWLGNVERTPSDFDARLIETISDLDEIVPSNSITKNMEILLAKNAEEAKALRFGLENSGARIKKTAVENRLRMTIEDLKDNYMAMRGEPWKEAEKMFTFLQSRLAKFDGRPESLLDIRQDLDKFMESQFGTKVWNPEQQSALKQGLKALRDRLNDQLDEAAPNVGVKKSLEKQFLLKTAAERMALKNSGEVGSRIGRAVNNSLMALNRQAGSTARSKLGTLALLGGGATAGAASTGALATISPTVWSIFGAGIGAYGVYKVAVSPKTRLALGHTLKLTNQAIHASKNAAMIETLKQDREKIIEALKLPTAPYEPKELENISEEDINNMFDFAPVPPRKQ